MEEIWKDIKDYEGYQVSNFGRVKSLAKKTNNQYSNIEMILKPQINTHNYLFVTLYKNHIAKQKLVHRLVYETFVGEIPDGMQVNHLDEDVKNNRLENLNLMTCKENINWGTGIRRRSKSKTKPVLQYDLEDNFIKEWSSAKKIEQELGCSCSKISLCCNGKRNTTGGYKWKYK